MEELKTSHLSNALNSVITGKNDFCCLCLNNTQEESIRIIDEVVVNIQYEQDITFVEVLSSIFDETTMYYIMTFNTLCEQCAKSAISSYKFIQSSRQNTEYFTNVIDGITNSFEYTTNELFGSKSLYVSLNPEDFTSKQYYDTKRSVTTPKAALQRFHKLDNKIKVEGVLTHRSKEDKSNTEVRKRKSKNVIDIPTSDMLYDKNNRDLLKCKECLKMYPTIWNLRNHYIRVHAPKVFKCNECPRSYGSAAFLDAHKTESHCSVVCSECGRTFNNRHTLKMHELGHHLSLVCQDCGRVYKNKATFKKHIELNVCGKDTRAHPSEAKYTCDYCNKKYTQKVSLRVHIQYEHGNYKAHVCEWCGKKFWAQSRLKAHIVKHTREKNFSCNMCGGKFVSKESLLYHTRTHTGEKPYKCPHCDSRFLSASRRTQHVKSYHLGATLECDICHSKFNTRTFLLKHKKTHMKSDKINMTYDSPKLSASKSYLGPSRSPKSLVNSDIGIKEWKLSEDDEMAIQSLSNVIESNEVDMHHFVCQVYDDDTQQSTDEKVYLEVSDDADDFMRMAGVGT